MTPVPPRRLLVPALLLIASPCVFGDRPSHDDDPSIPLPKDIAKLLDARLGKSKLNVDNAMLKKLIEQFRGSNGGFDPKQFDAERIRKLLENNPEFNDPEKLEQLRKMVQKQLAEQPDPKDPKVDWKGIDETLRKMVESPPAVPKNPGNPKNPNDPMRTPPDPSDPKRAEPLKPTSNDKQADEFARWLSRNFGNTPATQALARDFAKLLSQNGENGGMPQFLKDLEKEWKGTGGSKGESDSSGNIGKLLSGMKLPNLTSSGANRPNSTGGPSPGTDSPPDRSTGGGSRGGVSGMSADSWVGPLLFLGLALGAFYYWYKFLRNRPQDRAAAAQNAAPWPVDPHRVATREEVVKAFDFLSVSKCGAPALNWHHWQIAEDLSNQQPDNQEAVQRLARLYEKARYAPAIDLFSEMEIAEARARLCLIAGVATA